MSEPFQIVKAVKAQKKARIALDGGPGTGKTYTALQLAVGLAEGGKIGLLDTERSSANMYADEFEFDTIKLTSFAPLTYVAALEQFGRCGYAVVIVDSLSHAWEGDDGALQQVEAAKKRHQGNSYVAWGDVTPMQNKMMAAILDYPGHVIATMRTKVEIVVEKDERTGKSAPRKIGLKPIQREGVEFEFDVIADLDLEHNMLVSKTRLRFLDGKVINKPTPQVGLNILADLNSGTTPAPPVPVAPTQDAPQAAPAQSRATPSPAQESAPDGLHDPGPIINPDTDPFGDGAPPAHPPKRVDTPVPEAPAGDDAITVAERVQMAQDLIDSGTLDITKYGNAIANTGGLKGFFLRETHLMPPVHDEIAVSAGLAGIAWQELTPAQRLVCCWRAEEMAAAQS